MSQTLPSVAVCLTLYRQEPSRGRCYLDNPDRIEKYRMPRKRHHSAKAVPDGYSDIAAASLRADFPRVEPSAARKQGTVRRDRSVVRQPNAESPCRGKPGRRLWRAVLELGITSQ